MFKRCANDCLRRLCPKGYCKRAVTSCSRSFLCSIVFLIGQEFSTI